MDKYIDNDAVSELSQYSASRQNQIAGLLQKDVFRIVSPKKIPSNTQVFDLYFIDEIENPCTNKAYDKNRLVMQAHNNEKKNLVLTQLPTIQRAYIQSTSDFNQDFYIRSSSEQISLPVLGVSLDCSFEIIKPLHDMPKISNFLFTTY